MPPRPPRADHSIRRHRLGDQEDVAQPCDEFFAAESIRHLGKLVQGETVTLVLGERIFANGVDHWLGTISFAIARHLHWRLDVRFASRDARALTARVTSVPPRVLSMPVIHSCISEMLNGIAGPIKSAIIFSKELPVAPNTDFQLMLPKIAPAFDYGPLAAAFGYRQATWQARLPDCRLEFDCIWSPSLPANLSHDDATLKEGEIEML